MSYKMYIVLAILQISKALQLNNRENVIQKILEKNPTLTFLGQVGEKRFFHESVTKTWHYSVRNCDAMGMKLVAIESESEYEFLKTAEYPTFYTTFWTSGRDSLSHANYIWDSTGGQLGDFGEWQNDSYNLKYIYMTAPGGTWREWGGGYGETSVCQL